jgi:polyhydroxybutyrate depolymerase
MDDTAPNPMQDASAGRSDGGTSNGATSLGKDGSGFDGGASSGNAGGGSDGTAASTPPSPSGCITDVSPGDHTFTCDGLQVDMRVPAACEAPGCGMILELHGDTGTGLLEDAHTKLRDLGAMNGYIVVAPTGSPLGFGSGSTWSRADDATLVDIMQQHATVFRTDPKKVHVTGFSRGGFVTWRLLCDHADLFASAAPGGAGDGTQFSEATCFSQGRAPSRKIPILLLMGRTDADAGYPSMTQIRDAALVNYGTQASGSPTVLTMDANYTHNQWKSPDGATFESLDHAYETVNPGPWSFARGHCIPGSTVDPQAPQYALPCNLPNAFAWGQEVMTFFLAHPMP